MMRRTRWMLAALATVALAPPPVLRAQQGAAAAIAELRIRVTGEKADVAASGVLPFDRQGLNAVLALVATDSAGRPVNAARFAPRWVTSDSEVVSLYGDPTGPTMRVVAQEPGRATVTVTVLGRSASIPVIVGRARETLTAAELTPKFQVARLELTSAKSGAGDAEAELTGRALLMKENGHALILNARAYSADGTPIPLDEFPVAWTTGNAEVAELLQPSQKSVLVVAREHGRTTVTATIQGVSVAVEAYVGDRRADVDPALLAAPARSTVATGTGPAASPTTTPATTTPATGAPTANAPAGTRPSRPTGAPPTGTATPAQPASGTVASGGPPRGDRAGGAAALTAPANVRTVYVTGGMSAVRWAPVPGATGYVFLVRTPGGAWAGGNQLTVGNGGVPDTVALTRELGTGSYELKVAAVADDGARVGPYSEPVTVAVPRWHGRYRVTINGIRVHRETLDDPVETDGKRDEVFLRAHVGEFTGANMATGAGAAVQSLVHGDVNAAEWQSGTSPTRRVKAGSASGLGGLKTGDVYPANWASTPAAAHTDRLPLLVWEGDLYQGQAAVMVTPTIWESDQRPGIPPTWTSASSITFDRDMFMQLGPTLARRLRDDITQSATQSQAELDAIAAQSSTWFPNALAAGSSVPAWAVAAAIKRSAFNPMAIGDALLLAADRAEAVLAARVAQLQPVAPALAGAMASRGAALAGNIANLLDGTSQLVGTSLNVRDRPIGVQPGPSPSQPYRFVPQTLLLTFENVEARLAAGTGMDGTPPGFVAVRYTDGITALGGQGDYTIYLQVHRIR